MFRTIVVLNSCAEVAIGVTHIGIELMLKKETRGMTQVNVCNSMHEKRIEAKIHLC